MQKKLLAAMRGNPVNGNAVWSGRRKNATQFAWDNGKTCVFGCYIPAGDGLIEIAIAAEGDIEIPMSQPIIIHAESAKVHNWKSAAIEARRLIREAPEYAEELADQE